VAVSAWGETFKNLYGDAQVAYQTIMGVSEALGDETGREALSAFGVNADEVEGPMEALRQIMSASEDMEAGRVRALLMQANVEREVITAILAHGEGLNKLIESQKEHGAISEEEAAAAKRLGSAFAGFTGILSEMVQDITVAVTPALDGLFGALESAFEWMIEHKTVVVATLSAIAAAMLYVLAPAISASATATWALAAPILAVIIPIAALGAVIGLVIEDIMAFIDGQDSLIGKVLDTWPVIGDIVRGAIDAITGAIGWAIDSLKTLWAWLSALPDKAAEFIEGVKSTFSDLYKEIERVFNKIYGFIKGIWDKVTGVWDGITSKVEGAAEFVQSINPFADDDPEKDTVKKAQEHVMEASANQMNAVPPSVVRIDSQGARENTVRIDSVMVQTQAKDAKAISRDISTELGRQLKGVQTEAASGVAR